LIFADGFESGNLSAWSGSATDGGDLGASSQAAIIGNYGLKAVLDDNNSIYVRDDRPNAETQYGARFYFSTFSLQMSSSETHSIFQGYQANGVAVLEINLTYAPAPNSCPPGDICPLIPIGYSYQFQIEARALADSNTWVSTGWKVIAPLESIAVEVQWAAGSSSNLKLYVNGVLTGSHTGINNASKRIDSVRLGAVAGVDSGTRGTYIFDAFESRRNGQLIGLAAVNSGMELASQPATPQSAGLLGSVRDLWSAFSSKVASFASAFLGENLFRSYGSLTAASAPLSAAQSDAKLQSPQQQTNVTTINYTYDPLSRLTAADYSDGSYSQYAYDPVGNRTALTTTTGIVNYAYDEANRLVSAGGVAYGWDLNGNLLSDRSNTYSYDHANRLIGASNAQSSANFAYNGLGDRLRQTMGGVTTQYTLDINNSLSQVLADGANRYLYGMGRIAQQTPGGWQYFLPDALGSARQLTDVAGALALAQSFDPYGGLLSSQGSAATPYGFTGEWGDDASGLIYLRARYYLPQAGIFTARDPFPGVATLPVTLQPYLYAAGNPLRYTDPSGRFIFLPLLAVAAVGGLVGGVGYYALQMHFNHDPCARWEWKDAVFWGGVGTGLGALLGVGIYGGWWVGVQAGWWGYGSLSIARDYGIKSYDYLRNIVQVSGLRVHHLVEQRLSKILNIGSTGDWPSVVITKGEHQEFTNEWRAAIGYINSNNPINTSTATIEDIWMAAQEIYADYPALLAAVRKFLFK
jgi:RHS repeat-associated protein